MLKKTFLIFILISYAIVSGCIGIPKNVRPRKDQPFYHLLAENDEITYEAYVSEQNLLMDDSDEPIKHPLIEEIFSGKKGSSYFKMSN